MFLPYQSRLLGHRSRLCAACVYKPVPEASTRVVVLRTGEADVVFNLPPADQDNLKQNQNIIVHNTPSLTVVMIELRVTKPPFNDKNVRYALNQAIDKDAIIKNVMRGQAIRAQDTGHRRDLRHGRFRSLAL